MPDPAVPEAADYAAGLKNLAAASQRTADDEVGAVSPAVAPEHIPQF
jgi:hypothetical protein